MEDCALVRVLVVLVCASLLGACGADEEPAAPAATAASTESCGLVAFTPNSDHGAFEIKATGTTCETAKAVATASDGQAGSFVAEGFECKGTRNEGEGLASTGWTCTNEDARVTFVTS